MSPTGGSPTDERPATGSHSTLLRDRVNRSSNASAHSIKLYTRAYHQLWRDELLQCDQLEFIVSIGSVVGCSVEAKREEVGRMR